MNGFFRAELAEFELLWASRDDALMTLFGRTQTQPNQGKDHVVRQLDPEALGACIAELDAIRNRPPDERSHASEIGHLLLALDVSHVTQVSGRGRRPSDDQRLPESCPQRWTSSNAI